MTEGAIFVAPGEGERRRNPVGGHVTYKVRGQQTNGMLNAFDTVAAPGEGPPLHVHPDADEVIYTLEGRFLVRLDELEREALPGTFIFIRRGIPHTWQNVGDAPARFLAILTPARLEELFDQYAGASGG